MCAHVTGEFKTFTLYFLAHTKGFRSGKRATCLNFSLNLVVIYIRVFWWSDMETLATIRLWSPSLINSGLTLSQIAIEYKSYIFEKEC